ncbi:MAG: hypothetical protein AAB477_02645 [Patescibacteria group bacterium]
MGKKLWFKRKRYGWGWTPSTWQGWLVLIVYLVAMVKSSILVDIYSHSGSDTLIGYALPFILFTTILIIICYKKGEAPKWQWGKSDIDKVN